MASSVGSTNPSNAYLNSLPASGLVPGTASVPATPPTPGLVVSPQPGAIPNPTIGTYMAQPPAHVQARIHVSTSAQSLVELVELINSETSLCV